MSLPTAAPSFLPRLLLFLLSSFMELAGLQESFLGVWNSGRSIRRKRSGCKAEMTTGEVYILQKRKQEDREVN